MATLPYKLLFYGSPSFSARILESISNIPGIQPIAAVTNPDKPQGRAGLVTPSSVSQTATLLDLPVFKPEKLDDNNLNHLKLLKPDIALVVAYGKIIPPSYLNLPKYGTLNLHYSLLLKYL